MHAVLRKTCQGASRELQEDLAKCEGGARWPAIAFLGISQKRPLLLGMPGAMATIDRCKPLAFTTYEYTADP